MTNLRNNNEKILLTEEALIGLVLKKATLFFEVEPLLSENDFISPKIISIYIALILNKDNINDNESFNLLEIAEKAKNEFVTLVTLKENKNNSNFINNEAMKWTTKDWYDYLTFLVFSAGYESYLDNYIKDIKEYQRIRRFQEILFSSTNTSDKENSMNLISSLQDKLLELARDIEVKHFVEIDEFADEFYEKLINQAINNDSLKTHIPSLDTVINGFSPGDFVILAARPSMGKTAFALELTKKIARKKNVAFFSIEMPNEQLLQRLIASDSGTFLNKIKNYSSLTSQQKSSIETAVESIKNLNLWLDDTPGIRLNELVWKARKLNSMHKLDIIFIDYLQLIELDRYQENRTQQVSIISRTLKALARELKLPIIALSQLSRKLESREDKRPIMSDIRESGSIEQDADLIMFLYRDNYYRKKEEYREGNLQEEIEVIISKHRNGPTGVVKLEFDPSIGTFEDSKE